MPFIAIFPIMALATSLAAPPDPCGLGNIRYSINSSVDYLNETIVEHVQVAIRADSPAPDSLLFWRIQVEAEDISIDSIFVNGIRVAPPPQNQFSIYTGGMAGENRRCHPDSLTFKIPFAGVSREGWNRVDFYCKLCAGAPSDSSSIVIPEAMTYGEDYPRLVHDADSIHSSDQRYHSFESFSFRTRVPNGLYFMSAGNPSSLDMDDGTTEYSVEGLTAKALLWVVFPEKYHQTRMVGSIPAHLYCDPKRKINEKQLREISDAIEYYELLFGKAPYDVLNIIYAQMRPSIGGGAAENFMVFPSNRGIAPSFGSLLSPALPHEAAHLWWGSSVNIREMWLGEGLASYWSDQYEMSAKGRANFSNLHYSSMRLMRRIFGVAVKDKKREAAGAQLSHYYEAPYIMSMLSLQMGRENFVRACRDYYREYRNCSPGYEEFKETVQRYSEAPLDSFFTAWVDSSYRQNYAIEQVQSTPSDSLYSNTLLLTKTGKASSYVPVAVRYKDKTEETFLLHPARLSHAWDSNSPLASVFIDPDRLILEERRSDNAWPRQVHFHSVKSNLMGNIDLINSFFSDEPGYHLYLYPDIPSRTERFGWDSSCQLVGRHPNFYEDLLSNDIDVLRVGYNTKADGLMYRLNFSHSMSSTKRGRYSWNILSERMSGRYYTGAGIKYGRYPANIPIPYPIIRIAMTLAHRQYHRLENVNDDIWPIRSTTTLGMQLRLLKLGNTNIAFEKGFHVSPKDEEYHRYEASFEKAVGFLRGRIFLGTTGGAAVQERFDPSEEGGMRSYEPFRYWHDHLFALNVLLKHKLVMPINMRLFGGHINPMTGGYSVSEFGFGVSIGNGILGLIADMPAYVSNANIDGENWDFRRFRFQIQFLNYMDNSRWEFRSN